MDKSRRNNGANVMQTKSKKRRVNYNGKNFTPTLFNKIDFRELVDNAKNYIQQTNKGFISWSFSFIHPPKTSDFLLQHAWITAQKEIEYTRRLK